MTKLSPSTTRAIPVIVVGAAELFSPAAWAGLTPKATECPNYLWMSENGSLAEREGFEPSVRGKPVQRISNPSPSATRPPLRELRCNSGSGTCQTASTGGFLRLWSLGVPIKRQIFCPGLFNETTLNELHGISRIKSTRSLSKTQPGVCQRRVESCRTNVPSPSYPS